MIWERALIAPAEIVSLIVWMSLYDVSPIQNRAIQPERTKMKTRSVQVALWAIALAFVSAVSSAFGHGLMEDPPSRNWLCGVITKPHEVSNGNAEYPECGDAFNTVDGGYQFMSVLTHARGRSKVNPLPAHVCGFGSETWQGGATPWDAAIDWPTTSMSSGRQEIKWNIQWGPHFTDTEEFRYWITKSSFDFEVGQALTWNDFESEPFCVLSYDNANSNANPDVIPLTGTTRFRTFCDVPQRSGRHIIYGEWGRNEWTLERFHGCVDVVFGGGSSGDSVAADIHLSPNNDPVIGSGSITLDGSGSEGDNLSYLWSVSASDASPYTLTDATSEVTTLALAEPDSAQTVTVSLMVSNNSDSSSANTSFLHEPQAVSMWTDLGALTSSAQTLEAGDQVSVRVVFHDGQDGYYPPSPLTLDGDNADAADWPVALAQAVNHISGIDIAIGVLDGNDDVNPVSHATNNRIYARIGSDVASVFLQIDEGAEPEPNGDCTVIVREESNPWWAGLDIGFDSGTATLDFSGTGLDINQVTLQSGVFHTSVSGQVITLTKPGWVSINNPGYMGFNGNNYAALATFSAPGCNPQ